MLRDRIYFRILLGLVLAVLGAWSLPVEPAAQQPERFTNPLGMEFVRLEAGSFMMGSPPSEPHRDKDETLHKVTLTHPFFMQVTEVTQAQWKALMGSNPSFFKECGDDCPVESVSWFDCREFIEKLNKSTGETYRLPTEAEWEYACRAGTTTAYSWGNTIDCNRAMFQNNTRRDADACLPYVKEHGLKPDSPAPVRSYPANPWGLYDMSGNVWEWCRDWYGPYPQGPVIDPQGPDAGRMKVRRGGSWFMYGLYCRCANRNRSHPATRYRTTGFRLIREVP
jgi:sulfatase modifying factor 1